MFHEEELICLKNSNGRQVDCAKKNFIKIFKNYGLNLQVTSKLKTINFQDVTLYLNLENKTPIYIKILNQINHI